MHILLRFLIGAILLFGGLWAHHLSALMVVETEEERVCQSDLPTGTIELPETEHQHCEGVLSDSMSLWHLISNMPQRVSGNTVSCGHGRHSAITLRKRSQQQLYLIHYKADNRREPAPFAVSASCHYYIFALRRILC